MDESKKFPCIQVLSTDACGRPRAFESLSCRRSPPRDRE
jgi:hypothetical protein